MSIKNIFLRFRQQLTRSAVDDVQSDMEARSSTVVHIGGQEWLFGLNWQSFIDKKELPSLMQSARAQGYKYYIVNQLNDIVGFGAEATKKLKNKPKSAAIHIAETASFGGFELFTFRISEDVYAFIALNEARPVPQFDAIGSEAEIMELLTEYRTLHAEQSIRYVGNTDWFDNIEKLSVNEVFSESENTSNLLVIPNYKLRALLLKIFLPLIVILITATGWFFLEEQKKEQEILMQEQDPNNMYERSIESALQKVDLQAQIKLDQWREIVGRVPVERAGWRLEKIICVPTKCDVTWQRNFGSYQDFQSLSMAGDANINKEQIGESPSKAKITEVLIIPNNQNDARGINRSDLMPLRKVLDGMASKLQDLSVLGNIETKIKQPELFPKIPAAIEQINNPVVQGEWSIQHELWSFNDLRFDLSFLELQKLTIQQEEKSKTWIYSLVGSYYAKAKNN